MSKIDCTVETSEKEFDSQNDVLEGLSKEEAEIALLDLEARKAFFPSMKTLTDIEQNPGAWFKSIRFSFSEAVQSIVSPEMRHTGNLFLRDGLAKKHPVTGEFLVRKTTIEEQKQVLRDSVYWEMIYNYNDTLSKWRAVNKLAAENKKIAGRADLEYNDWLFNGLRVMGNHNPVIRERFGELITMRMRLPKNMDEARAKFPRQVAILEQVPGYQNLEARKLIDDLTAKLRLQNKDILQQAKDAKVKGASLVEENEEFVSRVYNTDMLSRYRNAYGTEWVVTHLINSLKNKRSIVAADDPNRVLNDKELNYLFKGVLDNMLSKDSGKYTMGIPMGETVEAILSVDAFKAYLAKYSALDAEKQLEKVAQFERYFAKYAGASKSLRMKKRIGFNENYVSQDGQFKFYDILVNDYEALFLGYTNQITGDIALARNGIPSPKAWEFIHRDIDNSYNLEKAWRGRHPIKGKVSSRQAADNMQRVRWIITNIVDAARPKMLGGKGTKLGQLLGITIPGTTSGLIGKAGRPGGHLGKTPMFAAMSGKPRWLGGTPALTDKTSERLAEQVYLQMETNTNSAMDILAFMQNKIDETKKLEMTALDMAYKYIKGFPLIDRPNDFPASAARLLGDLNYTRAMGVVGFANISELGNAVTTFGWFHFLRNIPELAAIMRRTKDGKRVSQLQEYMDDVFAGVGNQKLMSSILADKQDYMGGGQVELVGGMKAGKRGAKFGRAKKEVTPSEDDITMGMRPSDWHNASMSSWETRLKLAKRITNQIGGQWFTTSALQVYMLNSMFKRFTKFAETGGTSKHPFGGGLLFKMSAEQSKNRLYDIGIDEDALKRILSNFKKFTKPVTNQHGRTVKVTDFELWDMETRELFILAMRRWVHRGVQQASFGERAYLGWLKQWGFGDPESSSFGRLMWQFRAFMMTAWEKHLLHGIQFKDYIAWMQFANSAFISGVSWITLINANSIGMHKHDKRKYLDKNLSLRKIAAAAFQRSAASSLLPSIINTYGYAAHGLDSAIFNVMPRVGLPKSPLESNPSWDFLSNKLRGSVLDMTGFVTSGFQKPIDRREWNRIGSLFPFSNTLVIGNTWKFIGSKIATDPRIKEHKAWLQQLLDEHSKESAFKHIDMGFWD